MSTKKDHLNFNVIHNGICYIAYVRTNLKNYLQSTQEQISHIIRCILLQLRCVVITLI